VRCECGVDIDDKIRRCEVSEAKAKMPGIASYKSEAPENGDDMQKAKAKS
jgi:hypothetical protein